jgi:2,3-dihydro-2,3-dihydroxybenzoate dehydrogenase
MEIGPVTAAIGAEISGVDLTEALTDDAICRLLADAGALVAAIDIDPDRLAVAETAIVAAGGQSLGIVADLRDEKATTRALDEAAKGLGPLHGLVHVAGGLSVDQWASVLDVSIGRRGRPRT